MKATRIFSLIVLICLLLCSCTGYETGKGFEKNFLESISLSDMPLPDCEGFSLKNNVQNQQTIRFQIDKEGFSAYVKTFVRYMQAREDIYHFGIRHTRGLIGEIVPHRIVSEIGADFDDRQTQYVFCFSLTEETDPSRNCSHRRYTHMISVTMVYEEGGYSSIKINTTDYNACIGSTEAE